MGRHGATEERSEQSVGNLSGHGEVPISGSSSPGPGPGEGLRASQSHGGLGLGNALQFFMEDLAGTVPVLRAPDPNSEGCAAEPLQTIKNEFAVLQDALSEDKKFIRL